MNISDKADLGSFIRAYRESKGMNLRDVSRELEMPYTSLAKMETGMQKIDSGTLLKLADLFQISLDELVNRPFQKPKEFEVADRELVDNFRYILENYLTAKSESFKEHSMGEHIRDKTKKSIMKSAELDEDLYLVTGSAGQGQWSEVSWLAIYLRSITTSATRGYYIVFLVNADLSGFYLSLNQGFTYFREKYGQKIGKEKAQKVASVIRKRLNTVPNRLKLEEIDLKGIGYLSKGYESGHIWGRYYDRNSLPSSEELVNDLQELLVAYKEIEGLIGNRTIDQFNDYMLLEDDKQFLETDEEEEKYQDNVVELSKEQSVSEEQPEQSEQKPDPIIDKGGKKYWPRDAKIAAKALRLSNYTCAYDSDYPTFISKATGKPFLECHHLVPMKLQEKFEVKLDKVSNIVILTPFAHRLIHHGIDEEKEKMLRKLYDERKETLESVGIKITFEDLKEAYGVKS